MKVQIHDYQISALRAAQLDYAVTVSDYVNAAFNQRAHAEAHYRACLAMTEDLPHVNIGFWYVQPQKHTTPDLIDFVLR